MDAEDYYREQTDALASANDHYGAENTVHRLAARLGVGTPAVPACTWLTPMIRTTVEPHGPVVQPHRVVASDLQGKLPRVIRGPRLCSPRRLFVIAASHTGLGRSHGCWQVPSRVPGRMGNRGAGFAFTPKSSSLRPPRDCATEATWIYWSESRGLSRMGTSKRTRSTIHSGEAASAQRGFATLTHSSPAVPSPRSSRSA